MRFRYVGQGWAVADPIHILGEQVERYWPLSHPADGTVASSSHAQWPRSDHGIDPAGIVRAIDVGTYDGQGDELAEQLRATRDDRLAYVIHDGRIFSSTRSPWQWRPYTGTNPHAWHVHVSTRRDAGVDRDGTPFDIDLGGHVFTVEQLQEALNEAGRGPLAVDGDYGPKTKAALVAAFTADETSEVTAQWVRGLVDRKTRNAIQYGDLVRPRKVMDPEAD